MKKHTIAYIDEDQKDVTRFQRRVHKTFDVLGFMPRPDLDDFVIELLTSGAKAFVVDFRLSVYRENVEGHISYNGAELVERILSIRKGFPCFVLTSFDDEAIQEIGDVNYVYPKEIVIGNKKIGQVTLAEKIRVQIEHYESNVIKNSNRFYELVEKSEDNSLSEEEENELLKLDSFLESTINDHDSLSDEKKNKLAIGKLNELINSTNSLLEELRSKDS